MKKLVHGGDIYSHGKDKNKRIYDFSANINPLGVPSKVISAVKNCLGDCSNYPDPLCRDLISKIANAECVKEEYIICGNGAADVIFRIVLAVNPQKALLIAPTFAEYEKALLTVNCNIDHFFLKEEDEFNISEDFIDEIKDDYDIMFLCNPNNPTGKLIEPELLKTIIEKAKQKDIILVIDECFIEFLKDSEKFTMKGCLGKYDNLIILRAFTKNYALAGFRLGFSMSSNEELNEKILDMGQPWSVSTPAQVAGIAALDEKEYLREAMELIYREKEFLIKELRAMGFKVFDTKANYIFFKIEDGGLGKKAQKFRKSMEEQGILIRNCGNYIGLTGEYSRIAVKSNEDNLFFVETMKNIIW
ncbi:MAG: histidinol-phosphate transaminase [Anaerovoracaceae bacterium]